MITYAPHEPPPIIAVRRGDVALSRRPRANPKHGAWWDCTPEGHVTMESAELQRGLVWWQRNTVRFVARWRGQLVCSAPGFSPKVAL